jgi:hypothetical protein
MAELADRCRSTGTMAFPGKARGTAGLGLGYWSGRPAAPGAREDPLAQARNELTGVMTGLRYQTEPALCMDRTRYAS